MKSQKKVIIIAGPNGAGKTTLAREFLPAEAGLPELIFLSLPSAEDAIRRVAERVKQGGHNVMEDVIRRRFAAGMRHFLETYRHRTDYWMWFDNSGLEPVLLEEGKIT